jgi:hypothetical protein
MSNEFEPKRIGNKNCGDVGIKGPFSTKFDYILKSLTGDDDYPEDACTPWVHYNVKVGNLKADQLVQAADVKTSAVYSLNAKSAIWDAKKSFDIPHPSKSDHRLRYICLEGPTADVYIKGKLINQSYIELPNYWKDFVDMENIVVHLTPNGRWQELYVDKIEWGSKIIIKNNSGSQINCDYIVYGERIDTTKNISEYKGLTPDDYPGDNREYNINGK